MQIQKVPGRLVHIAGFLAADPGQVRDIPAWSRTLRSSTVAARVPWLPYRVMERLEESLTTTSRVAEFGGGGSTLWFADRVAEVVTIEHDPEWVPVLTSAVAGLPQCTVEYRSSDGDYRDYVSALDGFPDGHFDAIIVDGRQRVRCLNAAITKVAPTGLLVLDDSDRAQYAAAFDAVSWPHVTYRGLTPTKTVAGVTTVWQRP